jgi:hypothetical protein
VSGLGVCKTCRSLLPEGRAERCSARRRARTRLDEILVDTLIDVVRRQQHVCRHGAGRAARVRSRLRLARPALPRRRSRRVNALTEQTRNFEVSWRKRLAAVTEQSVCRAGVSVEACQQLSIVQNIALFGQLNAWTLARLPTKSS